MGKFLYFFLFNIKMEKRKIVAITLLLILLAIGIFLVTNVVNPCKFSGQEVCLSKESCLWAVNKCVVDECTLNNELNCTNSLCIWAYKENLQGCYSKNAINLRSHFCSEEGYLSENPEVLENAKNLNKTNWRIGVCARDEQIAFVYGVENDQVKCLLKCYSLES